MRFFGTLVHHGIRAGTTIGCTIIMAEVIRDVTIRVCDTYKETHQATVPRRAGSAK